MNDLKANIFQRDYSIDAAPFVDKATRRDWVRFGVDNLYPQMVLDLVNASPLQKSILENKLSYMWGAGIKPTRHSPHTPNLREGWDSFVYNIMYDYVYLGAFAVQVVVNSDGTHYSFFHQPIDQVRLGQYNDKNVIDKAYLCTNWAKANMQRNVVTIKMWGSEQPKKNERYLMYFKKHQLGQYYYGFPEFMSAANYIAADAALSKYYVNYIKNNFSANLAITFPTEPSEEKKSELYKNLIASFGGSENAGNILLLFGENGSLPEIKPIESVNADLYNAVSDTIKLAIVSANRLTSPILAGITTSTGFSSKSDEIIAATVQYRLTVINSERAFVMNAMNDLLTMNGYDRMLSIQDYNLRDEFEGQMEENEDKNEETSGVVEVEENENNEEVKKQEETNDGSTENETR